MKRKMRYIVRPDEVTIIRKTDFAIIEYKEKGVPPARLQVGSEIAGMRDDEIVELYNQCLRRHSKLVARSKYVAIEIPLGSAQIEYCAVSDQWVPRGGVLRCLIHDDPHQRLVVEIDNHELDLERFGKLLTTYVGWAARIEFVPEEDMHRRPACQVRQPEPE
jgi:hypothetical protein